MEQTSTRSAANINQHCKILEEMNELHAQKNHDCGDSFHLLWEEESIAMARIRLGDNFSRFKTLSRSSEKWQIKDKSLRDSLIDLAIQSWKTTCHLGGFTHGLDDNTSGSTTARVTPGPKRSPLCYLAFSG